VESEALFVVTPPPSVGGIGSLCCGGAPPQGLCNAPHDSGMCWKQFVMCLEDTWFVAVFHSTSMHEATRTVSEGDSDTGVGEIKFFLKASHS